MIGAVRDVLVAAGDPWLIARVRRAGDAASSRFTVTEKGYARARAADCRRRIYPLAEGLAAPRAGLRG